MASNIIEIESAIVDRLSPLQQSLNLKIIAFPDKAEKIGRPQGAGQIIVGFQKETLSRPEGRGKIRQSTLTQSRRVDFELLLQLKNLRSHAGAYPVMDAIRERLTGLQPDPKADRMLYELAAEFVDVDNGIWQFAMTFAIELYFQKVIINA